MQPLYLHHAPTPPQTVQARRRALIEALRTARDEVSTAERAVDSLVQRLAEMNIASVGMRVIDEQMLIDANSRLFLARTQHAELRSVLLDAAGGLDMEMQDELGVALLDCFGRLTAGNGRDDNDEHRLGFVDLIGRRS